MTEYNTILERVGTNLVDNTKSITNSVECLAETCSIMGGIHQCESKQGFFLDPLALSRFLNPVPGNGKVAVSVRCLPSVAGETNFTCNNCALIEVSKD